MHFLASPKNRVATCDQTLRSSAGLPALSATACVSGKNFEHRRQWIHDRLEFLAAWSDDDVARRWWFVFPQRRDNDGLAAQPEPHELAMIAADPKRLDESAVAACLVYVDLNPIRAGIAKTPETSQFTSAYERIQAIQTVAVVEPSASVPPQKPTSTKKRSRPAMPKSLAPKAAFLCPLELAQTHAAEARELPLDRASNRGCLPISLPTYLQLLDWTGRQIRSDKRGAIPAELAPVLERLQVSGESLVGMVKNVGRTFRRAAGTPKSLAQAAARYGRRWLHGVSASR